MDPQNKPSLYGIIKHERFLWGFPQKNFLTYGFIVHKL